MLQMRILYISWGRTILTLVLMLATLQLLHMLMLTRLESTSAGRKPAGIKIHKIQQVYSMMQDAMTTTELLDSSGEYKIIRDVTHNAPHMTDTGQKLINGVTLVTQCSVNHLHHLFSLLSVWHGPISVTLYTPVNEFQLARRIIASMYVCNSTLRTKVSFHLVLPLSDSLTFSSYNPSTPAIACNNLQFNIHNLTQLHNENYILSNGKYPNNLLRNVAQTSSRTTHTFVIDIDMLPNANLYETFLRVIREQASSKVSNIFAAKTAYIIPAFEILSDVVIPQDKVKLLSLWNRKLVRPFYQEVCWKCQKHTDYAAWRNTSLSSNLKVAYEVEWWDPWEPFYITQRSMPLYDERFKQYGFNRISQLCEMHVAGYKFAVLNNAFLVHRGFKRVEGFHSSKERELQENKQLFRQFKQELKARYPETSRRC